MCGKYEQLQLELKDARLRIPWGGRSPRSLTKCGKLFKMPEPATGVDGYPDPAQYTLFLKGASDGS